MEKQKLRLGTVAFSPKGKWNAETEYKRLNVVHYLASSYYAKKDNVGQTPSLDSEYWGLLVEGGDVVNNPDEEDITTEVVNDEHVLKLADRDYRPDQFSGKGYKILRKNLKKINLAVTKITVNTNPTADGEISITINNVDTHVTIAKDTQNTTALVATAISEALVPEHEDYDVEVADNVVTLTRKHSGEVEASAFDVTTTGMTLDIEDSVKTVTRNLITPVMVNKPNTIYEIRYDFDLDGQTIEVPENCTLKFEGGSLENGKIDLNFCKIINGKIRAYPISFPYQNTFKVSDFDVTSKSNEKYNVKMVQSMLDVGANVFFDSEGTITFNKELHWIKNSNIYGISFLESNKQELSFPNSKGFVAPNISFVYLKNLKISSSDDAITVNSGFHLIFDTLFVKSENGTCFVGNVGTSVFECHFNEIRVIAGKYGFDHFNGNTTTFNNINCWNAKISIFNYCTGTFYGCNGCWGKTPHFMTTDSGDFSDILTYSFFIYIFQTNIESYTDTLFDFTGKNIGAVNLYIGENVSLYNYKGENGKYYHSIIASNGLNLSSKTKINYKEEEWEKDVYPITYNGVGAVFEGSVKVYDKKEKTMLNYYHRNTPFLFARTEYIKDYALREYGLYLNRVFDTVVLNRLFIDPITIIYPKDKDKVQLDISKSQSFIIKRDTEDDIDEVKTVQIPFSYITDHPINYGKKRKQEEFVTVYNSCKNTSLKVYGEDYFGISNPILKPEEVCVFHNCNGKFILFSLNELLCLRAYKDSLPSPQSVDGVTLYSQKYKKLGLSSNKAWIDVFGNPISTLYSGTSDNRPSDVIKGTLYFDTTLNKPIWWTGSKWVDAIGADV